MFDLDVCLVCGMQVQLEQAYCSDRCEQLDTSPAMSSCNTVVSSPNPGYPLGSQVKSFRSGSLVNSAKRYSTSSSSASSTCWSASTDDEDDYSGYSSCGDYSDSGSNKRPTFPASALTPALLFKRRPSVISNQPTVPILSRHTSSGSEPDQAEPATRISPKRSPLKLFDHSKHDSSVVGFTSRSRKADLHRRHFPANNASTHSTSSPKRSRDAASLPSYLPLLRIGNPPKGRLAAPTLSTLHPTPSTPIIGPVQAPGGAFTSIAFPPVFQSRLRETAPGDNSSRRSEYIDSCSRQSTLRQTSYGSADISQTRAHAEVSRGRSTQTRSYQLESSRPITIFRGDDVSLEPRPRGRMRVSELDGIGTHPDWPGYGKGRSGLRHRECIEGLPALR